MVKSKTRLDHFDGLREVFYRCCLYKLKMNKAKCAFGVSTRKYLGFLVNKHGISVEPSKSKAIQAMQPPKNLKQLRSFISNVSYIPRFIPSLAKILFVFGPLLKKGTAFIWTEEHQ